MRLFRITVVLAGVIATSPHASAPALAEERRFDVVSVKKHIEFDAPQLFDLRGVPAGRVRITAMSLFDIIKFVYPDFSRDHQIEGGPAWLTSDRFDIEASFAAGTIPAVDRTTMRIPASLLTMLQAMLADRFKLKVRSETKDIPIYALVLARKDGQLGPRLKRSSIDCMTPGRPLPSEKCGMQTDSSTGLVTAVGVDIDMLTSWLELMVRADGARLERQGGRPIENITGLTGSFDFTYDQRPRGPDGPSIFTMIQEEYGLKLESRTGTAKILIIEHVEQPTPN